MRVCSAFEMEPSKWEKRDVVRILAAEAVGTLEINHCMIAIYDEHCTYLIWPIYLITWKNAFMDISFIWTSKCKSEWDCKSVRYLTLLTRLQLIISSSLGKISANLAIIFWIFIFHVQFLLYSFFPLTVLYIYDNDEQIIA